MQVRKQTRDLVALLRRAAGGSRYYLFMEVRWQGCLHQETPGTPAACIRAACGSKDCLFKGG